MGGDFTAASGAVVNHIARWDGTSWSSLPGPAGTGTDGRVLGLAVFDDGSGPALYVAGDFTTAGGIVSSHIAAWRCDALAPIDPTSLWSPTHTPGVWSAADVVEVEWSGASDSGGSGLAGYSVLFDTEPTTVPDTTVDVPQTSDPHSTSSGVLADGGNHWFHLRTCDGAGNCSPGVHLGPFLLDTTPPGWPFDLASTSHTPGVPYWDRTVDMVWTPAADAGSGLDGYAVAVTGGGEWTCDQVKVLEEDAVSLTTPDLADGLWFVHLCASDNLGHWGDVVTAGPYLIAPLFADGFESGATSAWSLAVP